MEGLEMGAPKLENMCVRKQLFFSVAFLTDKLTDGLVEVSSWLKMLAVWSCDPRNIGCVPWGGNGLASRRGEVERLPRNQELLAHTDCKHFRAHTQNSSSRKRRYILVLGPQVGLNLSIESRFRI